MKLTIDLLPKGAWGNNLSRRLKKEDWDRLRQNCYKKADNKCEICGFSLCEPQAKQSTILDAHEEWDFDIENKTQTLKNIVALCSRCHGVKHFRNSERLGFGENAKRHFCEVNKCSPLAFAAHYAKAQQSFEKQNEVFRWKMVCDLERFGGRGVELKERNIPLIDSPYEGIDWSNYRQVWYRSAKEVEARPYINPPKMKLIEVNNYQGEILIVCDRVLDIEMYLDGMLFKKKYYRGGEIFAKFKVENLEGSDLEFVLNGKDGQLKAGVFKLTNEKGVL